MLNKVYDDARGPKDPQEKRFCLCIHQKHQLNPLRDTTVIQCLTHVNKRYVKITWHRAVELANIVKKYYIETLQEKENRHVTWVPERFAMQHDKYMAMLSEKEAEIARSRDEISRLKEQNRQLSNRIKKRKQEYITLVNQLNAATSSAETLGSKPRFFSRIWEK
ncbi:MAG: hypothetical protein ACP5UZ_07605 [Thermoplasmata archaeon]